MASNLSQNDTGASKWVHLWQSGLPPFADWNNPRWGLFLLLVLAGDVIVATLAWIIVWLVMN
jgi:hypothetical protein